MSRIKQDHSRFREIVRGRIRQNLKKYISRGELIGKQGKDRVAIPLPQIDTPRFKYDPKDGGGVGQGDGKPGDSLGKGQGQPGEGGKGEAGEGEGEKALEVEVTMAELAEILGEELQLPRIEPRGEKQVVTERRTNDVSQPRATRLMLVATGTNQNTPDTPPKPASDKP